MSSLHMKTWIAVPTDAFWTETPIRVGECIEKARDAVSALKPTYPPGKNGQYHHVFRYDELIHEGTQYCLRITTDELGTILKEHLMLASGGQWWDVKVQCTKPTLPGNGGYKLHW